MLVPKKNRLAVYSYLFNEGVIVTKKALLMDKHPNLEVPLLHVVKLLLTLKSKGFVKERYTWQYLYYTLTDTGIEYLRNYLHVSELVVPATLKKPTKPQQAPSFGNTRRIEGQDGGDGERRGGGRGGRGGRGRGGYRGDRDRGERSERSGDSGSRGGRGGSRGGRGGSRGGAAAGSTSEAAPATTE